jgi:two-component system, sensor histidine kinase and response regulator
MSAQTARILVVDDEPISLKVLASTLQREGYEVVCHDAGESAKHCLAQDNQFDVIILDRLMPGVDGMALLAHIQADERLSHIPVVMLTGVDDSEEIIDAVAAGVFDYLTKPVDGKQLLGLIKKELNKER